MAHMTLHFAFGVAVGTAATLPPVIRAWRKRSGMTRATGRMLAAAYGAGTLAAFPGILDTIGFPAAWLNGAWTNCFLCYGLIERRVQGGLIYGGAGVIAAFTFHYTLIIACIVRCGQPRKLLS